MNYTRVASFNTLDKIDHAQLGIEIMVRGLRCEMPDCMESAVTMMIGPLPALLCRQHNDLNDTGLARQVHSILTAFLKRVVLEAANRAWHGSEDEEVFTFQPTPGSTLISRYLETPDAVLIESAEPKPAVVRPPIATLPVHNTELVVFELFPM